MKLLHYGKDGGPDSTVWGFWLIEWKPVFSVALLCFEDGSREAFHDHAFNSFSWLLKGNLKEYIFDHSDTHCGTILYYPSIKPIRTARSRMHKVASKGRSWVLTFRGPWKDTWQEWLPKEQRHRTLTHGRIECQP